MVSQSSLILSTAAVIIIAAIFADNQPTAALVNVALDKHTLQSTTNGDSGSNHSTDGDDSTCSQTLNLQPVWWLVDLLKPFSFHSIAFMTVGFGADHLKDFSVFVSEVNPIPIITSDGNGSLAGDLCLNMTEAVPGDGKRYVFYCDNNSTVTGRYVYIWKPDSGPLGMCEFEVLAPAAEPDFMQTRFNILPNTRYNLPVFHQTTMPAPLSSRINCAYACLTSSGGVVTVIELEEATGKCECVEKTGMHYGTTAVSENGWLLMESDLN